MKIIHGLRRHHYAARLSIFLIAVALIAGMVGCTGEQCALIILSTDGGQVTTPGEGTHSYDLGKEVDLVATPDIGYRFEGWTGDVETVANKSAASTTIIMNGNYAITANFAPCSQSLDYFPITPGYGIKYHVTDTSLDTPVDCNVWAVSQDFVTKKPHDLDFVFTLIGEGMMGRSYVPGSLGGQISHPCGDKECTAFYAGYPVGNQGNFYMNFCLLRTFDSGDQWTVGNGPTEKKYTAVDLGVQTIPGIGPVECVKVTIDDSGNTNPHLQGSGYFVLAKGYGIVELGFARTDTTNVLYEYVENTTFQIHTISGTVTTDGLAPKEGIVIAISHANWGIYSVTDAAGAYEIRAFGPDLVLRAWYDENQDDVSDDFDVTNPSDPKYPRQYCVNNVDSDPTLNISLDISQMWLWGSCYAE